MPMEWVVGLVVLWIALALLMLALCGSVRSIDDGLGERTPLDPVAPEPPPPPKVEVE